jgi:hypothetical protein
MPPASLDDLDPTDGRWCCVATAISISTDPGFSIGTGTTT